MTPMRAERFLAVASSIFLTKLVKLSLISRAKIIATGLFPFSQTWQTFWPAPDPVTFNGWKGPGIFLPTGGPDLSPSTAMALPSTQDHDGLPVSIQIAARAGADWSLLDDARALAPVLRLAAPAPGKRA